ncbi:MAG: hypothetical protein HYV07_01595 [Deltaproteobacteria bacterium]|nr:hypothetical protein [Deltaproteobacteria bacterium]
MSVSDQVRALLGARATEVLRAIPDTLLLDKVLRNLEVCAQTLAILDGFDLSKHEISTNHSATSWGALAPQVGQILVNVQRTHDQVRAAFPAREEPVSTPQEVDIDQAFDSLTGDAIDLGRIDRSKEIDRVVTTGSDPSAHESPELAIAKSISSLTTMLQKDIHDFREQLRIPGVLGDSWALLAELHEFRAKCTQCLEAVVAATVSPFTNDSVETLLPRYWGAVTRALVLRNGLVDLAFDVEHKNQLMQSAEPDQLTALWQDLVTELERFASSRAYRLLRPSDKKEVVSFRLYLADWPTRGADVGNLRNAMEGFSRFLDFRRKINRREELVGHDRSHLEAARTALDNQAGVVEAMQMAQNAYGRSDALDSVIRAWRDDQLPAPESLHAIIVEALVPLNL